MSATRRHLTALIDRFEDKTRSLPLTAEGRACINSWLVQARELALHSDEEAVHATLAQIDRALWPTEVTR